jgi:DNA polymerase III epsilon subunit family exonuclease
MAFPSEKQRSAVEAELGPVLVIAGPGAGKTSCLVARVEHLIKVRGFKPERLCAVTFTNKAAEEISTRLSASLDRTAEDLTRGTIHSLCLAILRERGGEVGLQAGFGVADDRYQQAILARLRVPEKRRGGLLNTFGKLRFQGIAPTPGDLELYHRYMERLHDSNMVDFDDLVALTAQLFKRYPEIAEEFAAKWDYILVDECQDLNPLQYHVLRALALRHRNIFAVGDDEQSIFSWASADPQVLMRLQQDFGIREPIVLDRNCRCSVAIFAAARRLIEQNPRLFSKTITADRATEHEVEAWAFADEQEEAEALIADLQKDHAESGLPWGEYGILYRRHESGDLLEARLLAAGIPCRLSSGRAISDDPVISQVLASLRVMLAPDDPVSLDALADLVLPELLLDEVRNQFPDGGLLAGLRILALNRHPERKKAWRFIYAVENLLALRRSHNSLSALVDAVLTQGTGEFTNQLERDAGLLTDPRLFPGAAELARELGRVRRDGGRLWIAPSGGLEIPLRRMVMKSGFTLITTALPTEPPVRDAVLDSRVVPGLPLRLFKALQLLESEGWESAAGNYVTFDLETTDLDINACEIVEIGAARVRDNVVVERFHTMVRPGRSISVKATEVHGYTDADVASAPPFSEVWVRFREFAGDDLLVAHNGLKFDIPVLRRLAADLPGISDLVFYDSLVLAHSLFDQSARLTDLATRFGVETGRSHHALDDAVALAEVYRHLNETRAVRSRKVAQVGLLDDLGLALALEQGEQESAAGERGVFFEAARRNTLGRYGESLDAYAAERSDGHPTTEAVIDLLGGFNLMVRLRAERTPEQRYPRAVSRLGALIAACKGTDLDQAIQALLDRIALSTSNAVETVPNRVNLLTLHATKGLEFSRVYVIGVEDNEMPGSALQQNRLSEIEEARRLLYVGMTRAKDRLVLTVARSRRGAINSGTKFLDEIGLVTRNK